MATLAPLRVLAPALLAGSALGLLLPGAAPAAAALAATATAGMLLFRGRGRHGLLASLALLGLLAGYVRGAARAEEVAVPVLPRDPEAVAAVSGVVLRPPDVAPPAPAPPSGHLSGARDPPERECRLLLEVEAEDAPDAGARVLVRHEADEEVPALRPGDRVRVVGRVSEPPGPTNPGEPDRRAALRRDGVVVDVAAASAGSVSREPGGRRTPGDLARRTGEAVRRVVLERLAAACGDASEARGLLACLLLGDRSGVPPDLDRAFRRSGAAHLLSVSGLHVVLLCGAAAALCRRTLPAAVRRGAALPAALVVLAVYCAACRFATPVVRASMFLVLARLGGATGRRTTALDHLALAAAAVAAADPAEALEPGFHLSFAAVAGLCLLTRRFREALFAPLDLLARFPEAVSPRILALRLAFANALCAALAAQAATAPVVASTFGELQPLGPLVNVAAVPLAAALLPLAAALALFGPAAGPVGEAVAGAAAAPLAALVRAAGGIPWASWSPGRPPWPLVALSAALLLVAAAVRPWRKRHLLLPAAAVAVLGVGPWLRPARDTPETVALDVGHGLCVLVRSAAGVDLLFDAGGRAPLLGERLVVPALRALGVRGLDALVISHEDSDHCGAARAVLDAFPVGEVLVPEGFGTAPIPRDLLAACRASGVPVSALARGGRWARAGVDVRVLHPPRGALVPADNPTSLVAHVTLRGADGAHETILLPGDLEGPALAALAADATLPPARVLVLPHHGRGPPEEHLALARRLRAEVLLASSSASAPMHVPGAVVTGRAGAVRVRPGRGPEAQFW